MSYSKIAQFNRTFTGHFTETRQARTRRTALGRLYRNEKDSTFSGLENHYEEVPKIFRTGAAIYTAVAVAQTICPNRPNCGFRVLLRLLRRLRENVRRRRPELWREETWLLHHDNAPSHTSVLTLQFLAKHQWLSSPTHRTPLIWHPVTSVSKNEIEVERTPV
jgi:hypothetical protein